MQVRLHGIIFVPCFPASKMTTQLPTSFISNRPSESFWVNVVTSVGGKVEPAWFTNCVWNMFVPFHYDDVIMGVMASQITSLAIVYSTVFSGADQNKHQSSASLAFVRGIHRWPMNSPHKWPVTRKIFPFDDVIMYTKLLHCPKWRNDIYGTSTPKVRGSAFVVTVDIRSLYTSCTIPQWTSSISHNAPICIKNVNTDNIKAPRYWPLCWEFTGDRWIPRINGQ